MEDTSKMVLTAEGSVGVTVSVKMLVGKSVPDELGETGAISVETLSKLPSEAVFSL